MPVTLSPADPELSQPAVATAARSAIAAGIRYAVNHGATVIDLPLDPGLPAAAGTAAAASAAGGSPAERSAVSYALSRNVVLVAPAGDDGARSDAADYPAAYAGVIAVGAVNPAFVTAAWSSHQSYVTLTAAGAGVVAAASSGGPVTMNSTTAASAVVSGVAALLRSRYPALSAAQIRQVLTTTAVHRHGLTAGSGSGTVNADMAMTAAATLATPPADRAGAGAQPLAPAAAGSGGPEGVGSEIVRAGEVSGALLLVLLLIIALYAAVGRRRRRPGTELALTTGWTQRQAQSRYPQATGTDTDRMVEVFTAPVPAPDTGSRPARVALPAGFDDADYGVFASAPVRPDGGPATVRPGLAVGPGPDPGRALSHGPASRAVSRRPAVSGAPPWEPASAPMSELPWTAAPGGSPAVLSGPADPAGPPGWPAAPVSPPGGPEPGALPPFSPAGQPGRAEPQRLGQWQRPDPGEPDWASAHEQARAARWGSAEDLSRVAQRGGWGTQPGPDSRPGHSPAAAAPGQPWAGYRQDQSWPDDPQDQPFEQAGPPGRTDASAPGGSSVSGPNPPVVTPSGLPVRQPRASQAAPLSPSGSLWEPVDSGGASLWERAEPVSGDSDGTESGQPIFVWNPGRSGANRGGQRPDDRWGE